MHSEKGTGTGDRETDREREEGNAGKKDHTPTVHAYIKATAQAEILTPTSHLSHENVTPTMTFFP